MNPRARRLLLLALAGVLLFPRASGAATVLQLEVSYSQRTIRVDFEVLLTADAQRALELLTDCRQWPRLSDTVTEGRVLETFADGRQRMSVSFLSCVWIFCRTLTQVKDLQSLDNGELAAQIVPGTSDFRSGWERWHISTETGRIRVVYRAELLPDFTVPPLIGPWILKHKFRRELVESARRLEALASR